jgi:hypothetical protein
VNPEKENSELNEISRERRNFLREIFWLEESEGSRGPPEFQKRKAGFVKKSRAFRKLNTKTYLRSLSFLVTAW